MPSEDTQFKPGNNANPGGRPKGFANKIKALCGEDYEKLAVGLYTVAFGTSVERLDFFGEDVKVTAKDRVLAMKELRDSGPGRPVQTLDHRGNVPSMTRVIHEEAQLDADELPPEVGTH